MWWYSLSEQKDVDVVWAKAKRDVENIQRMKTTNPRCLLDKMAVKLLNNFSNLSKDEIFVLKLALSHIVDFLDEDLLDIYKKNIDPFFWKVVVCEVQTLREDGDDAAAAEEERLVRDFFEQVVKKVKEGIEEAQIFVAEKKIRLLKEKKGSTFEFDLVLAAEYIVSNIEEWRKKDKKTEAEVVSRLSDVLKALFRNTKLNLIIGETCAECTKTTRKSSEASFSGGSSSSYCRSESSGSSNASKNVFGRKVGLTIRGEENVKLALCEFKAGRDFSLLKKQEGKNLRLNQCVLEDLKDSNLSSKIVAFNWGGKVYAQCAFINF
ncbi:uncharacterized protein B0P05DRAFT_532205 [Gilbertella persicaria]|uniref:uncharacterized protein n=1 Tax=Gilbertella persicaria TaxID=101096 RepID=UPI00221F70FB|nr:uncharacterized protein B0P05DRAFT_532205 [Gilbertella persicaria]KAI8087762.1 hypothetical protein B0P05DRAFT_532205 [Gilbertella persicaria]